MIWLLLYGVVGVLVVIGAVALFWRAGIPPTHYMGSCPGWVIAGALWPVFLLALQKDRPWNTTAELLYLVAAQPELEAMIEELEQLQFEAKRRLA